MPNLIMNRTVLLSLGCLVFWELITDHILYTFTETLSLPSLVHNSEQHGIQNPISRTPFLLLPRPNSASAIMN